MWEFSGNQHLNEAFKDYVDTCNVAWIGGFPGIKVYEFFSSFYKYLAFTYFGFVYVADDSIGSTVELLSPPPHRMQIVRRDERGVIWVDDSKATNVEATYTGIMGLKDQKSVVLLGGLAKVLNAEGSTGFEQLVEQLEYHICVITVSILPLYYNIYQYLNLITNFVITVGDAIVLSPGCASFDEFRNFQHRGEVFQKLAFAAS
ncbi:hypothetical protein IFM89_006931 [Coptis chinensis]|uniref:UDP-N-acetylmuramoylalanine--D-glutamate ligase n=1 Tax=Coptis chinensis TaxID=261450 RepID=A0A835LLL6_9MAGN|nr:hypothetical protein IFM89_006931 [Coptis chinensis]